MWAAGGIIAALGLWWLIAAIVGESRLPTPYEKLLAFIEVAWSSPVLRAQPGGSPHLWGDLWYTMARAVNGSILGTALGIAVGIAMGWSQRLNALLEPVIEVFRTIPPLAAIPFFLMWFGPTAEVQLAMLVFYAFLRLVINTVEAIRTVSPVLRQYAMTLGADAGQVYRTVVLPAIVPELIGAFRVVLAASWGLQIVAELLGSPAGIGKQLTYLVPLLRPDLIMALILWVTISAVVVDQFFLLPIARRVTRWVPSLA